MRPTSCCLRSPVSPGLKVLRECVQWRYGLVLFVAAMETEPIINAQIPGRMGVDRSTAHHGYFQCDSTWCRHPSSCLRARDTVVGIDLFKRQAIAAMLQGRKHSTIFSSPVTLGSAIHFHDLKYKASCFGIHFQSQAILDFIPSEDQELPIPRQALSLKGGVI